MKKPLDEKQKLALTIIDPSIAQTRQWQDTEDNFSELDNKVDKIPEEIINSSKEIKDVIHSSISDLNETLKKKLDEELVYEVDEQKIVDSVLAKVKIPDPIPGKDANEESIIKKMVPLVLEKIPKIENLSLQDVAKEAYKLIPKSKPQVIKQIDKDLIISEVLQKLPKLEPFKFELTQQDLLSRINKYDHEIDWKVLKNIPYDVLHGGKSSGKIGRGGATLFSQLKDVALSGLTNGQVPIYNSTTGKWENGSAGSTSPLTTKGDLYGFSTVDARVPVGADGKVLTADSTDPNGISWQNPASSSALTYMFANIASDIATYYQAVSLSSYTIGTIGDTSASCSTTPTIIGKFVTNLGFPNITVIPAGTISIHVDTEKVAGSNNYYVYAEIYKRNLAGTETLLATSDNSTQSAANTQINQTVTALLATNTTLLATDRLVVKIYGVMVSSTATIHCYFDDSTSARIEFPTTFVDPTNYVTINTDQNITGTKTFLKTGLGTTTTDAINVKNTTPATSGNQQVSPAITRTGQGWKTESGGVSQSVAFRDYVLPVQSSANPTAILKNQFSINGGTWTDAFWYDQTPGGQGFALYTSSGQSNGSAGTTRIATFNNTGQNTWLDFNFSGTRKSSLGADNQGQMIADTSSNNGFIVRVNGTAFHYLGNGVLLTYGYGGFQSGINAGSTNVNTSTLQSSGGTALKVARLIVDTTLDNSYTKVIADATGNSSCTGTPTYDCSHWSNQTDCELRNSHGGCTWNAGSDCSAFNNEFGMGSCLANSPCSASSTSCVGPSDEATCLAQDDTYGGDCAWNPGSDCSAFNGNEAGCSGQTGCSVASSSSCASQFDEGSCNGVGGCFWDGMTCTGDNSTCSGTYGSGCSGNWYTGVCLGTYGASCSGTSACGNIIGSSNCSGEAGCSYVTRIQLYLPDLTTCPDRDYWIINGASGGEDVIIYPYSGQTVDMTTSYTISNYKDGIHLSPYNDTRSCASLAETPCGTTTGCTQNYSNCSWDAGGNVCNGGTGCSGYGDEGSCNSATYFSSCSGTYVVSKNWYIWSRT